MSVIMKLLGRRLVVGRIETRQHRRDGTWTRSQRLLHREGPGGAVGTSKIQPDRPLLFTEVRWDHPVPLFRCGRGLIRDPTLESGTRNVYVSQFSGLRVTLEQAQ